MDNSKCLKCRLHCWVCVRHSFNKMVLAVTKLIMPYPPTVGILLLTSVSPCFLNHPVISQPLSKLLQCGSVPTVSPRRSPHRCSDDCPTATPKADPYSVLILLLPWAAFNAPVWEVLSALGVQGTSHSSRFSLVFPESFFSTCPKMSPSVTLLFPAAAPCELHVHPHEFQFNPQNCALFRTLDLYVFITTSCTSQTNFISSSLPSTPNHLFMLKSYCVQTWKSFLPPPSMATYQVVQSLQWVLNSYTSFHLHCMSHSASGLAH